MQLGTVLELNALVEAVADLYEAWKQHELEKAEKARQHFLEIAEFLLRKVSPSTALLGADDIDECTPATLSAASLEALKRIIADLQRPIDQLDRQFFRRASDVSATLFAELT